MTGLWRIIKNRTPKRELLAILDIFLKTTVLETVWVNAQWGGETGRKKQVLCYPKQYSLTSLLLGTKLSAAALVIRHDIPQIPGVGGGYHNSASHPKSIIALGHWHLGQQRWALTISHSFVKGNRSKGKQNILCRVNTFHLCLNINCLHGLLQ